MSEPAEFGKWRTFLWPIHRYELKKLIPMLLIFFLISFDYNVLRMMKDTLVVTAESSGAEVIPFIKVWVMFPGSILMTIIFARFSNLFNREKVFYLMMGLFLGYFALFTFVLYPARDLLHPHQKADYLQAILPLGFKGMIAMYRNWILTSFYAMSELWGNIVLFVLFWGFANQITKLGEAKRFYGLLGIGANFSGVVAGQASVMFSRNHFNPYLPFGKDAWDQSVVILMSLVLLTGITAVILFRWMHRNVLTDRRFYDPEEAVQSTKQESSKISLTDALQYVMRSRYLLCIALIVLCYNFVINLVEVLWKNEVRELYSSPLEYSYYMNQVSTLIGALATTSAFIVSGNAIRKFGWTFTAMLTPGILLATSVGFFSLFFLKQELNGFITAFFGVSALQLIVFFGSAQNVLCRAAKYSVFDATREMAFVPLASECKVKGKAAIDGVCSRLGKSGGSLVHQSLLLTFSTITDSAPYVAVFLLGAVGVWTGATYVLGRKFEALTAPLSSRPSTSKVAELSEWSESSVA